MSHTVQTILSLADYQSGGIVSRKIVQNTAGSISVFAFDRGEALSEHTAAYDAWVQVIEGEGEFLIDGHPHRLRQGECLTLPAGVPHAVNAPQRFKMVLTMIRA